MSTRKAVLRSPELRGKKHSLLYRCAKRWEYWSINFDTRKQLLELDQHELDDIGMTRQHALKEGKKPFWRD